MKKNLYVAILYGGKSVEHEISIRSARNVVAHIDKNEYTIVLLGIDKNGGWYLNTDINQPVDAGHAVAIKLDARSPHLIDLVSEQDVQIDVVFPVLHGTDGEDGSVQGMFKTMNLPIIGSGVLGSAIAMDKIISKKILKESGIPVASYIEFKKSSKGNIRFAEVEAQVGLPFMIKSAALGSSVGITMVKSASGFLPALEEGFRYGDKIIIEQFVKGRELECAVMGNEHAQASMPCEIVLVKEYDFYTYEAKYLDEAAVRIDLPANLDEKLAEEVRRISVAAYRALRCDDFARVDLFLTETGEIMVNEINTIPGFTNASMFPMMWQHMGIGYSELISKLISLGIARHQESIATETDFKMAK
ncbi:MAG: D-alanine--D-alanine ligase [Cyclobacteriaceae bacterium]|nr:D-alanine--D-alanine ligase [Cyclobacteriaceae bacterium]